MSDPDPTANYRQIRSDWRWCYRAWYATHYILGILAIFLSTLVASKLGGEIYKANYDFLAWLLALVAGILTFLSPEQRGNKYQRAWLLLNSTIARYDADMHTVPEDVIAAHELGENIIRNVTGSRDTALSVVKPAEMRQRRNRPDKSEG